MKSNSSNVLTVGRWASRIRRAMVFCSRSSISASNSLQVPLWLLFSRTACSASVLNLAACIADELDSDADRVLSAAYVAVREKLTAPTTWAAVEALAGVLVQRQTLNIRQAYRVIRRALPKNINAGRTAQ